MVDDTRARSSRRSPAACPSARSARNERGGSPLLVRSRSLLTGDRLTDAQPGFDGQTNEPAFSSRSMPPARASSATSRARASASAWPSCCSKGKGEVVTAPVIRSEIGGGRVQISGRMSTVEANDITLLLRAGSLAAPMEIIEERTVGPSLGRRTSRRASTRRCGSLLAIVVHVRLLPAGGPRFVVWRCRFNLLLLVALLSLLQATLTLPGIAAMALTLGMAIDSTC